MSRAAWSIAALALALRCGIAFGSLDALDRWFVPDDTYYTLGFARSLAHGLGPTLDGVVFSNGFQPLLAFLLVPVFWFCHTGDAALRAALLFGAVCDAAIVVLLAQLADRLAGRAACRISALLWASSPLAIANALGGLETSLALALELGLVLAYVNVRDHEARTLEVATLRRWAAVGGLAGLAILARIDAVFLVAALTFLELAAFASARGTRASRSGRWIAVACTALVLTPWWGYCLARFGTPIPESGLAVWRIIALHRERYLTVPKQLGWAAGYALGAPFFDVPLLRDLLLEAPELCCAAFALVAGALLGAAFGLLFFARRGRAVQRAAGALVLHGLAVLAFYALVLPALWFFRRYLAPCQAVFTLLSAVSLAWAVRRVSEASAPFTLRATCAAACFVALALALLGELEVYQYATVAPRQTRDRGLHGAKGYREAARAVLDKVPAGAVLGAFQSGALSYYAPRDVRVVNLDGVVDRNARQAAAELRLADYARSRGITLLSDWHFNLRAFERLSKNSRVEVRARYIETQAESQGGDRFLLFELRWPDAVAGQRKPNLE